MNTTVVTIPAADIRDWESFHTVFQDLLGFPDFYGRNMDAWIDCMSDLDEPDGAMSRVTVAPGDVLMLRIDDAAEFQRRCPAQYRALLECAAFVNWRRLVAGDPPVLALMISGYFE